MSKLHPTSQSPPTSPPSTAPANPLPVSVASLLTQLLQEEQHRSDLFRQQEATRAAEFRAKVLALVDPERKATADLQPASLYDFYDDVPLSASLMESHNNGHNDNSGESPGTRGSISTGNTSSHLRHMVAASSITDTYQQTVPRIESGIRLDRNGSFVG